MKHKITKATPSGERKPVKPAFRQACLIGLLLAALGVYLLMNYLMLGDVLSHFAERGAVVSVVYLAWLGCGFLVFLALLLTARVKVLAVFFAMFLVSLATNYSYIVLGKRALSPDVMEWLPYEAAQLPNAWAEFPIQIAIAVAKALAALAIFAGVRIAMHRYRLLPSRIFSSRRSAALAGSSFVGFNLFAMLLQPPNSMAETNLFVFGVPAFFSSMPDLRPVPVDPIASPLVDKVLLVVDESVTFEAYSQIVRNYVSSAPLIDFGEAASTANCSAQSNALLRWGVEKPRLSEPDYDPRTNSTIWAYARKAGFKTVLIDGQSGGSMQNYLGVKEFSLIDEVVTPKVDLDTDERIGELLNERLRRPGREFMYVVKRGAHFPYEMNYPAGFVSADAPRAVKYRAAVSYSTGAFFGALRKNSPFRNVLLIYTSDHGQAHDQSSSHCNPSPGAGEYSVPMVVMTDVPTLQKLLGNTQRMQDRASHLNIFPTLLYAFGYERRWTETVYGPTLAGPPEPYITYVSMGWRGPSGRAKGGTVDTRKFVQSNNFPHRKDTASSEAAAQ